VLRGDVDHAAAHLADRLLLDHRGDRALAAQEDAAEVHGHDRVPVLLLRLEQRLRVAAGDARVADHDVQPPVALERGRHEVVDVRPARGVRLEERSAPAQQLRGRPPALARVAADVADDDERSLVREAQRDRPPEARSAAGDDRCPTGEPACHDA
jgi:hypothetical protein